VYETGTRVEFERWASPWRGLLDRIAPTPGNHDWPLAGEGYKPFWREITGEKPPNFYSFRAGGWQILSINSQLERSRPTRRWLRRQLEPGGNCRIAFWHRPRFNAGHHGPGARGPVKRYWDLLKGDARIVVSGHDHDFQRMQPRGGMVQFIAGTGGRHLHDVDGRDPRLAFSNDRHYGALRLELSPGRARWRFVAVSGDVLDSGSLRCRA
jgi:calcineurin-like phosphoesterase family protein